MTKLLNFLLLILTCTTAGSQSLRQQLLRQDTTFVDVELTKCKFDSTIFIAVLVNNPDWWEWLRVVKFEKHKIVWTAKFDTMPQSQSILSAREISLPGFSNPLIEVFDQTHMGNGFYYLYELKGRNAKTLASIYAVDTNEDGEYQLTANDTCYGCYSRVIKHGHLQPVYTDVNSDGFTDIKLTGTIQIVNGNHKVIKQLYAQKVLLYNKTKKKFIEDKKLRKGFKQDDM